LSILKRYGVREIRGLDGAWVDREKLVIQAADFEEVNLEEEISINRKYDLAISVAVAEALTEESAGSFIQALTESSDFVLFSAAIPYQGGICYLNENVNEQWPDYWSTIFSEYGFTAVDYLREKIWNDANVEVCYAQNIMLYVKENRLQDVRVPEEYFCKNNPPLPLVHPELYLRYFNTSPAEEKRREKYRGYKPYGFGESMSPFVARVKSDTTLQVSNIFEIGANYAQDADFLKDAFNVPPENVYVFEAHPEIYEAIKKIHKFNAYNYAVFNEEKEMVFNIVPLTFFNTGMSSIFKLKDTIATSEVKVQSKRMDNFMNENNIAKIDFLKLDVEGATYEVLEGFGERLSDIQTMHIEAEHGEQFNGAKKFFNDISELLKTHGFEMVYFQRVWGIQSDSFWINKKVYKY
jgi:FkbM family methyltransferase